MDLHNTHPDDAALRYWLRPHPAGTAHHRMPAWLDHNVDAAATRSLLSSLLVQWVADGNLRRQHAHVWAAEAGVLGAPPRQSELASEFGVSDRTIRAWVRRADSVITREFKNLDLRAILLAKLVGTELSAHPQGIVSVAALLKSLVVENAPAEHLEAVRAYAADHLGGPRPPRRPGAKRWVRHRFYPTVGVRAAAAARTVLSDQSVEPGLPAPPLLAMPYRLADQPTAAISELSRAWNNRDRVFVPLLANHALRTAQTHPEVSAEDRLHMLEVIANGLRDAENLQAFVVATQWKVLATRAFGPLDPRVWKAEGLLIHMMQIHGYTAAARRAQQRHIATFHQARFADPGDRALHVLDRFARLITIETEHPSSGSRERTQTLLHNMRVAYEREQSPDVDNDFTMLRRRLEVALTDAVAASHGQPVRGRRLDSLSAALENFGTDLQAHRALARHELLLKVDVARRDWVALRQRMGTLAQAVNHPAAPANLAERIRARLDALATRGHLADTPHLVMPIDPFRDRRFSPLTAAANYFDLKKG